MAKGLFIAALAVSAGGCAGGMTRADCVHADWAGLGFADGRSGYSEKASASRLKDCASDGLAVDRAAYAKGRAEGLAAFCTAAGGFDAGRLGQDYRNVCPAPVEPEFLDGFDAGAKLRALIAAETEAVKSREAALEALDRNGFLLKAVDKRAASPTIGSQDREAARTEAASRRRDIAQIEHSLHKLETAIAKARADRESFEAELRAAGRIF